jgi:hypothetical protein
MEFLLYLGAALIGVCVGIVTYVVMTLTLTSTKIRQSYLPPLHGGYKPRPNEDRIYDAPPKPPKGSGGGSR